MKKVLTIFCGFLMFAGCGPENEEPIVDPKQGKLKEIAIMSSLDDTEPNALWKSYDYDEFGRLSVIHIEPGKRKTYPFDNGYEKLTYDDLDRLMRKTKYRANLNEPPQYRLEATTIYTYNQDNLLIEETTNRPLGTTKFTYEYENGILIWRNEFETDGDLYQRIRFEYDQAGNKIAEWIYWPGQTTSTGKVNYIYENNKLISADVPPCAKAYWTYDELGRIATEEVVVLSIFCSLGGGVLRYYYYD